MNLHYLTPAGRLFELMTYLHRSHDQANAAYVWGEYFEIDHDRDRPAFFAATSSTLLLPAQARESVAGRGERDLAKKRLDRALEHVDAVFSLVPNLYSHQMSTLKGSIDTGTLSDLETASDVLSERLSDLEEDGVDDKGQPFESDTDLIRRLAAELAEAATESDLPADVAVLLNKNAQAIVQAIDLFKIKGPEGLFAEYERLVGAIVVRPETASAIAKSPTISQKLVDLSKTVVLFGAAFAVAGQVAIEAVNIYKTLEPLVTAATQG